MRIRRRATDASAPRPQAPSSSLDRSPPSPPPSAPSREPASPSETAAPRCVEPPAPEVDPSMCEEAAFDLRRSSGEGSRQEEEKEESGKATEDDKRGKGDGRSAQEHGRPVHVVSSTRAAPKSEEVEDSGGVKDEKKSAAATCKKGDGKGWHCKRVAQCGYSLCQYHLDKLRSYSSYSQKKKTKKKPRAASVSENSAAAGVHRQGAQQKKTTKRRRKEEHALGTGPAALSDSFYYYSGFGPRWGKRRGDRSEDGATDPHGTSAQVRSQQDMGAAAAVAARGGGGGGGPGEEEEEEDEYDCEGASGDGKPFKSRPLSSLL